MSDSDKTKDILEVVVASRKVIGHILNEGDGASQKARAVVFVLMLQQLQQLVAELVEAKTPEDQAQGIKLLDDAIADLQDDQDDLTVMEASGFPFNSSGSNKGNA